MLGMGLAKTADCVRRNHLRLPGAFVITKEFAVRAAAIDDVGIGWVRRDVRALAGSHGMPVAEGDRSIIAAARGVDGAAVLLCTVDMVRKLIVNAHVVHLCCGLVVPTAPGAAAIHAYAGALVAAGDHTL